MMGQETRNKLTDYWKSHEIKEESDYAILTNIIHKEWSGISVRKHKQIKGLKDQNKIASFHDHKFNKMVFYIRIIDAFVFILLKQIFRIKYHGF